MNSLSLLDPNVSISISACFGWVLTHESGLSYSTAYESIRTESG